MIGLTGGMTNVFEILEQVGHGLPLAVSENRLVQTIAGFP